MAVKSITLMWPSFELTLTAVPGPAGLTNVPLFSYRRGLRWVGPITRHDGGDKLDLMSGFAFRLARYARRFLVIGIIGFGRSVTGLLVSRVVIFGSGEFNRSCLYRNSFIQSALIDFGGSLCERKSVAMIGQPWSTATNWILNRDMIDRF